MPTLDPATLDTRRYVGERVTVVYGFRERLHGELRYFERGDNHPESWYALVRLDEPEPGVGVQVFVPIEHLLHDTYHDHPAAARGES